MGKVVEKLLESSTPLITKGWKNLEVAVREFQSGFLM